MTPTALDTLNTLYQTLVERKTASADSSYVANLYQKGTTHIGRKVCEEATETLIEALTGDKEKLKSESADLLFHLLVLWADQGITPQDICDILDKRMGISGLEEKKNRKN